MKVRERHKRKEGNKKW